MDAWLSDNANSEENLAYMRELVKRLEGLQDSETITRQRFIEADAKGHA